MQQTQQFLVDEVEKKLLEYFETHNIKMGDLIPKELDLIHILGVSRTVVREALGRLRTQGLIESKRKRGTILTNPDISQVLENTLNPTLIDKSSLKEYFEMRMALEIGMADLIIARKRETDIVELREIIKQEPLLTDNTIFSSSHEVKFHGKLYNITRNSSMMKFQNLLLPIFDYVHRSDFMSKPIESAHFVSHADLVDIIDKGTAHELRIAMRNHLDSHFQRILR